MMDMTAAHSEHLCGYKPAPSGRPSPGYWPDGHSQYLTARQSTPGRRQPCSPL